MERTNCKMMGEKSIEESEKVEKKKRKRNQHLNTSHKMPSYQSEYKMFITFGKSEIKK